MKLLSKRNFKTNNRHYYLIKSIKGCLYFIKSSSNNTIKSFVVSHYKKSQLKQTVSINKQLLQEHCG